MSNVSYEWIVEEIPEGEDGDIHDTHAFDDAIEATAFAKGCENPVRLGVTRNRWSEAEGLIDRQWAYPVAGGGLPERFDWCGGETGGAKVPVSIHRLWNIWVKGEK